MDRFIGQETASSPYREETGKKQKKQQKNDDTGLLCLTIRADREEKKTVPFFPRNNSVEGAKGGAHTETAPAFVSSKQVQTEQ